MGCMRLPYQSARITGAFPWLGGRMGVALESQSVGYQ